MTHRQTVELPVVGMDCASCAAHVRDALCRVPGVETAEVLLSAEKALVRLDPARVDLPALRAGVVAAGYRSPERASAADPDHAATSAAIGR